MEEKEVKKKTTKSKSTTKKINSTSKAKSSLALALGKRIGTPSRNTSKVPNVLIQILLLFPGRNISLSLMVSLI